MDRIPVIYGGNGKRLRTPLFPIRERQLTFFLGTSVPKHNNRYTSLSQSSDFPIDRIYAGDLQWE
jgi:hypothetical protein